MTEPHVMDALRGKRSELSGIVSHLEQQIVQHRASRGVVQSRLIPVVVTAASDVNPSLAEV